MYFRPHCTSGCRAILNAVHFQTTRNTMLTCIVMEFKRQVAESLQTEIHEITKHVLEWDHWMLVTGMWSRNYSIFRIFSRPPKPMHPTFNASMTCSDCTTWSGTIVVVQNCLLLSHVLTAMARLMGYPNSNMAMITLHTIHYLFSLAVESGGTMSTHGIYIDMHHYMVNKWQTSRCQ